MSKETLPFHAADISHIARSLRTQLAGTESTPGHVEMLNMLARSAGYRNFQHFRVQAQAQARLEQAPPPAPAIDFVKIGRLLRYFGPDGRWMRWPSKYSHQEPCLWVVWSHIPARRTFTEPEINVEIAACHGFGDHVLIRRELVNHKLIGRTRDGRSYWRIEREPPAEARELIRRVAKG